MAVETSEPYYLLSIKVEFFKKINQKRVRIKNNKRIDLKEMIYQKAKKKQ